MAGLAIDDPVTLTQALASVNIVPGDVLELANGTYPGDYTANVALAGTEAAPVIIKPRNPGMVTIDGSMKIEGAHVHLYDLNFTDSRADKHIVTNAIYCARPGFRLHGCIVQGLHNSGVQFFGGSAEVSENMILNCGYLAADESGHGHNIYTHNHAGGPCLIARNMFSNGRSNYCLQIYSGGANYLRDYTVENNVTHGDATTTGGGLGLINFVYRNNIQYSDYIQHGRYSGDHQNDTATIEGNEAIDLSSYTINANTTPEWLNLTEQNNIFYGDAWPTGAENRPGYTLAAKPATKVWLNQFSKSARWLGNVVIFNRDSAETVSVDFSSILGAGSYRLRNSGCPTETWDFEYGGSGTVDVPTAWTNLPGGLYWPVFGSCVIEAA